MGLRKFPVDAMAFVRQQWLWHVFFSKSVDNDQISEVRTSPASNRNKFSFVDTRHSRRRNQNCWF